jgi:hypothetical protein
MTATTAHPPAPAPPPRARLAGSAPRVALAAAIAAAVTVVAWRTGDWWTGNFRGAGTNRTIARVLLFAAVFGAVLTLPGVVRRATRPALAIFAGWTLYLGVWLVALWPGILMTDSVDAVVNTRQGIVYEWFSYVHSLINLAVLDVVPNVAAFGVLQILATAALMAYASALVLRAGGRWWAVAAMNLLAALSAPLIVNTLLYSRDTLFALGHVFLALAVAEAVVVRRSLSKAGLVAIAGLTGVLSVYRGDGIVLILVVPLLLLLLRPGRRVALQGAAVFAASLVLFHVVLPALCKIDPKVPDAYALSLRLNPLGAVLNTDYYSADKAADEAALGRVINVAGVKAKATAAEIPAFWAGDWNQAATPADWDAFKATSDRLLLDNLGTVLGNRLATFGATTGLAPAAFTGTAMPGARERDDWIADRTGMEGTPPSTGLYDALSKPLSESGEYRGLFSWRAALQWNLLPWLLLLVVVLLAYRRLRFEAVVAAVILARVPLVFAAAPAAQYKYYYSVLLAGLVIVGLLLAHVRPRSTAAAA